MVSLPFGAGEWAPSIVPPPGATETPDLAALLAVLQRSEGAAMPGRAVLPFGGPSGDVADAWTRNAGGIGDLIARERAVSEERGLWNPESGLPTSAGVVDAANQWGMGVLAGSTAPRGGVPGVGLRVSPRIPTAVGTDAAALHAGNDLQIGADAITGTTAEPKVAAKLQGYPDVLAAQAGQDHATTMQNAIGHFKDNLRWIYDNMIPAVRERAAGWYDGAAESWH